MLKRIVLRKGIPLRRVEKTIKYIRKV